MTEVVVTAERRTSNLQTTPIAATVLTGAELELKGVNAVDQLQFISPSVTLNNYGQGNSFNIRGIGKSETNSTVTVGVVTYRDGVATFPGYLQSEPYYDIQSLEILRGPQGTFAGQNATGGAVVITEAAPTFGSYGGYLEGQLGNYDDKRLRGAINLPISSTFAARIAFNSEYRESFHEITGGYTGHPGRLQSNSVRLSLLWKPTEALTVSLKEDYNHIDMGGFPADPATATNDRFKITNNAFNSALGRVLPHRPERELQVPKRVHAPLGHRLPGRQHFGGHRLRRHEPAQEHLHGQRRRPDHLAGVQPDLARHGAVQVARGPLFLQHPLRLSAREVHHPHPHHRHHPYRHQRPGHLGGVRPSDLRLDRQGSRSRRAPAIPPHPRKTTGPAPSRSCAFP